MFEHERSSRRSRLVMTNFKLFLREREMFYSTTHSTHFIYDYMASDIWLRTILIARKETRCRHIGYSYRLTARVLLYAPSHIQDNTYHGLWYPSRGALAGWQTVLNDFSVAWYCGLLLSRHHGYFTAQSSFIQCK